jgi:hypothetical protein
MRILVTIPHYYNPTGGGWHGSVRRDPRPRIQALTACLSSLRQLFGRPAYQIDIARREAVPTGGVPHQLDVVVCTTGGRHLLGDLPLPKNLYAHHATEAEPMLLGFECQRVPPRPSRRRETTETNPEKSCAFVAAMAIPGLRQPY